MAEEFSTTIKIPVDRVGVVIGTDGGVKKQLEQATHTKLEIDSKEGEVIITAVDGLRIYEAREVIRAIGRGFNPDVATLLLKPDYALEVVSIADFTGKNKNHLKRLKGRVIGAEEKAKREVEQLTETSISVYGKTVAIVGPVETLAHARRAIENLLEGSTHASVYRFLERRRREQRMSEFTGEKI